MSSFFHRLFNSIIYVFWFSRFNISVVFIPSYMDFISPYTFTFSYYNSVGIQSVKRAKVIH